MAKSKKSDASNESLKGLRVWIAGAAQSGVAAAKLLHSAGANVFVTDLGPITDDAKASLTQLKIGFEEKQHSIAKLKTDCDLLVVSPAIPLNKPLPLEARQLGLPIISEIEVASWFLPPTALVIGVTGTNGKSTVTNYLAQLYQRAGRKAVACGNFGLALCSAVTSPEAFDTFVVELSSYQLETTHSLRVDGSVFLNLQTDHQLRYGSMDEYLKAKWRLALLTKDSGVCVVDESVFEDVVRLGYALPRAALVRVGNALHASARNKKISEKLHFGQTLPIAIYGELAQMPKGLLTNPPVGFASALKESSQGGFDFEMERHNAHLMHHFNELCLPGIHNRQNLLAASALALQLGVDEATVLEQWEKSTSTYRHLAHRLERVARAAEGHFKDAKGVGKAVELYNDSKATNVESTKMALTSFKSPVRLLLGGEPKGETFLSLSSFLGKPVTRIYPFGKAAQQICANLASFSNFLAPPAATMLEAASLALEDAKDGEVILLSPGCASFDEFKNFEHRGDIFRRWAQDAELTP